MIKHWRSPSKTFLAGAVEETKLLSNKSSIVKSKLMLSSLESEQAGWNQFQILKLIQHCHKSSNLRTKDATVTAPIDGVIQDFKYQTVGERLAGDVIATIISELI